MRRRWTEVPAADVLASLERDVFPAIGAMPPAPITRPVSLNALRLAQRSGKRSIHDNGNDRPREEYQKACVGCGNAPKPRW